MGKKEILGGMYGRFNDLGDKIFIKNTADEIDKERFNAFVSDAKEQYRNLIIEFCTNLNKLKDEKSEEFEFLGITVELVAGNTDNEKCEFKPDACCLFGRKSNIVDALTFGVLQIRKENVARSKDNG